MPIARFQMPDGRIGRFEVPEGTAPDQAVSLIEQYLSGQQKEPVAPKERTMLEAGKDILAGGVSGVGALTQLPGQIYGLATGDFSDTGLTKVGRELRETGQSMKSEELKRRETERAAKIAEAGKEGQFKAGVTAFMETIKDPALLSNFIAEQAPNLIPGFAVARGLSAAGMTVGAVRGAVGTGAVQQGADIGAGAYEQLYKEMVSKGVPEEEAAGKALGYARATGAAATVISALAQRLPGGRAIEEAMAKVPGKGSRLMSGVKGGAGETVSEMIEEGGGKVAQNLAMKQIKPEQSLTEGLGETMGMAAVGGLGLGTAAGLSRRGEVETLPPEEAAKPKAEDLEKPPEKVQENNIPLLLEGKGAFVPVGLPDGSVAMTREDLAKYEEEQFQKKYEPQPVERRGDFVEPTAEEVERPAMTYGEATQEVEYLKQQPKSPEVQSRIQELQGIKMDMIMDGIRRSREPVRPELMQLREQMESGSIPEDETTEFINQALADFRRATLKLEKIPTTEAQAEVKDLIKEANALDKQIRSLRGPVTDRADDMKTLLRGKLTPEEVIDISPEKTVQYLAAKEGRRSYSLADLVSDGMLDKWLPEEKRHTSPMFDAQESEEEIKEILRSEQAQDPRIKILPFETQDQIDKLGEDLSRLDARIKELKSPEIVQQAVEEIPVEERREEAAQLAPEEGFVGMQEPLPVAPEEKTKDNNEYYPDKYLSIEPQRDVQKKPSFRREAARLIKKYNTNDRVTSQFAMAEMNRIYDRTKLEETVNPRRRGATWIRRKLLEAVDQGVMDEKALDFAEYLIKQNPALVEDLSIAIQTAKDGNEASGGYNPFGRMFTLFKGQASDTTAVHEILHHMERMMPENVQDEIRKLWINNFIKANKEALKSKNENIKTFFDILNNYHFGGGTQSETQFRSALQMIVDGKIPSQYYQYANASEFWAVNATDIMSKRFEAKQGVINSLRNWLKEFVQKIKTAFGFTSNAPIIKALDSLIKGDGKFNSQTMLGVATTYESIADKAKATAQKALQKRTLPKSQFEGVDDDYYAALQPVFAPEKKTIIDKIEGMRDDFWLKLAQGIADQYRSIKDISQDAYMKARMSKTVDGALEGILFNGEVKLTDGALDIAKDTKGLFKALEPVGQEVDRYQIWVALNRDAQLVAQGKAPSVNKDIVRRRNELAEGKIGNKSRLEVYRQVQQDMNKLNRSVLKVAFKQGIIDKEAYKVYARDINYIPFYKMMDENGDVQAAATKSGLVNQYFSKALKGGEKPFGDLMENTLRNWSHILSASMKNEAANATIRAALDLDAAFPNLKVGLDWQDGKVYSAKTGQLVGDGKLKPEYTTSGKGTIKTMINGIPAYFDIKEPLLLESIMSIGYMGPKSKFLDVARNFKNMLQFGVTLSPAFKIRNLFRDSISAMAVTDLKKNPFANVINNWAATDKNNPAHISALAGGAIFNFGSVYEGDQAKLIKRLLDSGVRSDTILDNEKKIKAGLQKAWSKYQEWGNKSEAANRMALYNQLKETVNPETNKNYTHLEASFYARDMLDFSMQGAWPAFRLVTQVVPFLNARVQGLYKLGRDGIIPTSRVIYNSVTGKPDESTASDKKRAEQFSVVMGAVALASLMLYMAFKDDEEFKKREQWDRDNFWWFKLPGMEAAFRVPKPFEIGALGTVAERVAEQIMDQGVEGKVFGQSLSRMMTDTFAINPTPQMFKPLIDLYSNKDSFTGAPIETAGMERLSKAERIAERTSPLAIGLSKVSNVFLPESMEVSPVQTDYTIKAYLGWLGGTISATSHYAVQPFSKSAYPDANWTETMSMGFIKSLPATQSKYVTAFYENNKEISQAYADMRHFAQLGEADKVQEILKEKGDKIAMAKFYDNASKDMSKMRQAIQAIRNDENMSGAQKKEEIDRMKIIIGEIAKQMEDARIMVKKQYAASQ
jgi:hypothetical protein